MDKEMGGDGMLHKEMASGGSSTDRTSISQTGLESHGTSVQNKTSFFQRYRAHMRKWWWAHALFFIASVLIVTLCLIYVGFPHIAQSGINDATLEITSLVITNPTANSIHVGQDSIVRSSSMYHPTLDSFNVSLSMAGAQTYGMLTLPPSQSGDAVAAHVEQIVQITDVDAFTQYNLALLTSEIFSPRVNGSTWLHQGGLPATYVNFDKTVQIKGLNRFTGFNITKFTVKNPPESDGSNSIGTVLIPNPSILTIAFGNVTFDNFVDGELIGNSTLQDLLVKPGNNTVPMRGIVDQGKVLSLLTTKYKDGILPIDIVGKTSTYNGVRLPYYELGLQKNTQRVNLNVEAALGGG